MIATAQHSASDDITSSQFTITDLHIQQINLFCYVYLVDQLHWTVHPTHLPVFEFMLTYGRAPPAKLTVLGCTVSDTLHVSLCTPSRTDCTGLYSMWHATRVNMHTQRNWLYWVVQYVTRYMCQLAHPAWLPVLTPVYSTAWSWRLRIENMATFTHCESTFTPMKKDMKFYVAAECIRMLASMYRNRQRKF
jgi:hypothetical protein